MAAVPQKSGRSAAGSRFDAILDAAEEVFAASGYDGASMRMIADRAEVAQALIHYHFGTKETLFEKMVARRSNAINDRRGELLDGTSERVGHLPCWISRTSR